VKPLEKIIAEVDKTHPHLGKLVALEAIAHAAKECLLVVSPAGCGKSTASSVLQNGVPRALRFDSVTRSGLKPLVEQLTGYQGLVVVDDLGKIDTHYSRVSTVTTFCELVYSHEVVKHSLQTHIEIVDFHGSAILNCQPSILKSLVKQAEWEANIQDKTIRYYHLFRPLSPKMSVPKIEIELKLDPGQVRLPWEKLLSLAPLLELGIIQWSRARIREHLGKLLRATAALNGHKEVREEDASLLYALLRPMATEEIIVQKADLEEGRSLNSNLLCLLVEFATYGEFPIEAVCQDYKVSKSTAYRILDKYQSWWTLVRKNPTLYAPSPKGHEILEAIGGKNALSERTPDTPNQAKKIPLGKESRDA
jgi:hypothetical protein